MDITPELSQQAPLISRYGAGGFVIAGARYEGACAIDTAGQVSHFSGDITLDTIQQLLQSEPPAELLLIGTGVSAQPLAAEMTQHLQAQQLAYDIMDTGAACRSFNILMAEQRRVCVILHAV